MKSLLTFSGLTYLCLSRISFAFNHHVQVKNHVGRGQQNQHGWFSVAKVDGFCTVETSSSTSTCLFRKKRDWDDEEDDDTLAVDNGDWRAFRAKLVKGEKQSPTADVKKAVDDSDLDGIGALFADDFVLDATGGGVDQKENYGNDELMTPLDPSQWAYDSGDVIERGAVILGGVEQDFGFGLRQQYFHKAAILVLDHDSTFTKGIILNRPTDLTLEDDVNDGQVWRVWFGGDVEGLNFQHPDIVCLHSLTNDLATQASIPVMNDIKWTSFDNAKKLVKAGVANVRDFWVFVGYAGKLFTSFSFFSQFLFYFICF